MRRSGFMSVVGGSLLALALVLGACRTEISSGPGGGSQGSPSGGNPSAEGDQPAAARFFWGTWIRMDNGTHYNVYEDTVTEDGGATYYVDASSTTERMVVSGLGTFTKESDSVIMNGSIPYFRKGGANPSYRMRLVGFVGGPSRAAATTIHGWKVTGTSGSYPSYTNTSESDENGEFTLRAPVVGDTQTVTVSTDSGAIVVPGLTIENSGDFMGTIPLVDSGDYILKITGSIAPEEKLGGYLYGNGYKRYPMTLTITNVSQVKSAMAVCEVEWDDPNLSVTSSQNLEGIAISTMPPGATKTIDLEVLYDRLTEPYVDTEIKVRITNAQTGNEWVDYVPLRFFRGQVPVTVAAVSIEGNEAAALNGFFVHPDGQSQFFSVPHGGSTTIYGPTFPKDQHYLMAFSGATVTGTLSDSTEMFYTVAVGSTEPMAVETSGGGIREHMTFGEPNDSEEQAYPVDGNFQASLSEGEIDYFSVTSDTWKLPSEDSRQYRISYTTNNGESLEDKNVFANTWLDSYHLPTLYKEGYVLEGWYGNGNKVEVGYKITSNISLSAQWRTPNYTVQHYQQDIVGDEYILVPDDIETKTDDTGNLTSAVAKNYTGFTAKNIEQKTIKQDESTIVEVYYDRNIIDLTIDLDGGSTTTALNNGVLSGRYGAAVSLANPTKTGWAFGGWNTSGGKLPATFAEPETYKALWFAVGELNVNIDALSDITVKEETNGTTVTLTADAGYTSYQWKVDGVVQEGKTSNVLQLDTSSWVKGTYEVFLLAQDGGLYKSASLRITK
ncbi:MAG: InlB B-repeat-containing protein [Spirochaetaceae bacterium]|nr:InlB B-repeat-containing protein [Spirochaetaceae bacterium]